MKITEETNEINELADRFSKKGWVIFKHSETINKINILYDIFIESFRLKFTNDVEYNRTLIKRFSDHPISQRLYTDPSLLNVIEEICGLSEAIFCGPLVTHYTSNDSTGNGYGLPYHQDYPSMGSSSNSVICWVNLTDSHPCTHGIELISGYHKQGLLDGEQTSSGYILNSRFTDELESTIPNIPRGHVLLMSSYLPHKTFINRNYNGWKLSLSRRLDDLSNDYWKEIGFKNAYSTSINRELYRLSLK